MGLGKNQRGFLTLFLGGSEKTMRFYGGSGQEPCKTTVRAGGHKSQKQNHAVYQCVSTLQKGEVNAKLSQFPAERQKIPIFGLIIRNFSKRWIKMTFSISITEKLFFTHPFKSYLALTALQHVRRNLEGGTEGQTSLK